MLSERMSAKKSWLHPLYIYMLRISHIFLTLSTREYFILFLSFREETSIFIIVSGKSESVEKVTQISNRLWKVKAWNQW